MGNVCGDNSDVLIQHHLPTADSTLIIPQDQSPIRKANRVKILTYNIFIRPPPVKSFHDDYKTERLDEFTKFLNKYDIVCLQELFLLLSSRRKRLIRAAKEVGLAYSSGSPRHDFFSTLFCDGGLLTLSRYPIISTEFKPYPRGLSTDYYVNKGILYTKIQVKDAVLHLFSTHSQACYTTEAKYFIVLMNQWRCFRQFVTETLKKHNYTREDFVMAVGDFNVDGRNPIQYDIKALEAIYPAIKEYPNLIKEGSFHEYDTLVSILSEDGQHEVEELLYKQHGEHHTTFGDFFIDENNKIQPREQELTFPKGQCTNRRLDYIFKIEPKIDGETIMEVLEEEETIVKPKLIVKENSARVQKFMIAGKKFSQLSDHYGVKVTLQFQKELSRVNYSGSTVSGSPVDSDKE